MIVVCDLFMKKTKTKIVNTKIGILKCINVLVQFFNNTSPWRVSGNVKRRVLLEVGKEEHVLFRDYHELFDQLCEYIPANKTLQNNFI